MPIIAASPTPAPTRSRIRVATAVVLILLAMAAACSSEGNEAAPDVTCDYLTGRWVEFHQAYLDVLGTAQAGSTKIATAGATLAASLLELNRDAEATGCTEGLLAGSPLRCELARRLVAREPSGEGLISQMLSDCS